MSKVQLSEACEYLKDKYIVYFSRDGLIFHPSNRESPNAGTGKTATEAMSNAVQSLKGVSNERRSEKEQITTFIFTVKLRAAPSEISAYKIAIELYNNESFANLAAQETRRAGWKFAGYDWNGDEVYTP